MMKRSHRKIETLMKKLAEAIQAEDGDAAIFAYPGALYLFEPTTGRVIANVFVGHVDAGDPGFTEEDDGSVYIHGYGNYQ